MKVNEVYFVIDFLDEFTDALRSQLEQDQKRWGGTWLQRTRKGQEERIMNDYRDYYDRFRLGNEPMPWLKVVGNAMIAWIREQHTDMFPD